jgi:hypothetical protein
MANVNTIAIDALWDYADETGGALCVRDRGPHRGPQRWRVGYSGLEPGERRIARGGTLEEAARELCVMLDLDVTAPR